MKKINELKKEMTSIRIELSEKIRENIKYCDIQNIKLIDIDIFYPRTECDYNIIRTLIKFSTKKSETGKDNFLMILDIKNSGKEFEIINDNEYSNFYEKINRDSAKYIENLDEVNNIIFNNITNYYDRIINIIKEYSMIEYKIILEIKEIIKFKGYNMQLIDFCNSDDLSHCNNINLNMGYNQIEIFLPIKYNLNGKIEHDYIQFFVEDDDIEIFDTRPDIEYSDNVENMNDIKNIINKYINDEE